MTAGALRTLQHKYFIEEDTVPSLFAVLRQMASPATHCAHNGVCDDTLSLL